MYFVLIFSKLSTWGILCKGQDHWGGGGVEGVIVPGSELFWGEGGPKLSPEPVGLVYMGMLFWTLCVINRKTWYNLLKLCVKNTFQTCYLSSFQFFFLKLNWYMCAMRTYIYMSHLSCLYTCVNRSILLQLWCFHHYFYCSLS